MLPTDYALEDYRILEVLGVGGFGITYKAFDETLQEPVAIKEFLPAGVAAHDGDTVRPVTEANKANYERLLQDFIAESRHIARIRQDNVVRVRRCFKRNGTAYMVMDYEDGEELQAWLKRLERRPTEDEIRSLAAPLLDGLEAVHGVGLIHRDIKPQNIFIRRRDGSPVLLDFGAARHEDASHFTAILTTGYAPIEQYEEEARQGPWTDIYGLAAVLYRMVAGSKPQAALNRMAQDRLAPAAEAGGDGYSGALLRGIDTGLALLPENRPRSVAEWRGTWLPRRGAARPPAAQATPATPKPAPAPAPSPAPKREAEESDVTVRLPTEAPPATSAPRESPAPPVPPCPPADPLLAAASPDRSWHTAAAPCPPTPRVVHIADDEPDDEPRRFDLMRPSWGLLGLLSFFGVVEMAVCTLILQKVFHGNGLASVPLALLATFGLSTGFATASREINLWSAALWSAGIAFGAALLMVVSFGRFLF